MDITMNEEDAIKVNLDAEIQKLKDTCESLKGELKRYTQPLKQSVRDKHEETIKGIENEAAAMATKILQEEGSIGVVEKIVNNKVLDILSPILGFVRDDEGHFAKDGRISLPFNSTTFLRDEASNMVASFLKLTIREYLEKMDIEDVVQKSLNGMTAKHTEMVSFAKNLAKSLKEELGETAFGDNAAAQLIQTISWEMKAQREKKY